MKMSRRTPELHQCPDPRRMFEPRVCISTVMLLINREGNSRGQGLVRFGRGDVGQQPAKAPQGLNIHHPSFFQKSLVIVHGTCIGRSASAESPIET